tara:strand:- start:380 stop:907 length:528 start_codon:yes stop_codon:yes gene_type:complete
MSIDKSIKFIPINIGLLTISDTRSFSNDLSGDLLNKNIIDFGHNVLERKIIKDDVVLIKNTILKLIDYKNLDVIITTGGTGLTGRDSTPDVVEDISEKIIVGFGELFRHISFNKIGTSTVQSRAIGAIIKGKYIFSLPGSTNACKDAWNEILKYQLDIRHKPCNFIELIPRLKEK